MNLPINYTPANCLCSSRVGGILFSRPFVHQLRFGPFEGYLISNTYCQFLVSPRMDSHKI